MRPPKRPKWYVEQLVRPAAAHEVDTYGNAFAVLAICSCGHAAELLGAYAAVGTDWNFEGMRARMKCGRCGGRSPKIEVYRRPRA